MNMTIHYICMGNAFRSIMAEAYTRSLGISGLGAISSGARADETRVLNMPRYETTRQFLLDQGIGEYMKDHYADMLTQELIDKSDVIVCVNQLVVDKALSMGFDLPTATRVWDVTDIGEGNRIETTPEDTEEYYRDVYAELTMNVDALVQELSLK